MLSTVTYFVAFVKSFLSDVFLLKYLIHYLTLHWRSYLAGEWGVSQSMTRFAFSHRVGWNVRFESTNAYIITINRKTLTSYLLIYCQLIENNNWWRKRVEFEPLVESSYEQLYFIVLPRLDVNMICWQTSILKGLN